MELSNSKWLLRGCMWFSVSDLVTSLWLRYGRFVVFACFSYVYVQPDCKWWPATNGTPQYHHVETVRDCWRLLPSRFSSDLPYALCGSQFYPLEKIELTGLRNNTWNMELNGPLAEISEPQSQQEMRAERKAEREARLKMFRRPRDQIVTKWSGATFAFGMECVTCLFLVLKLADECLYVVV